LTLLDSHMIQFMYDAVSQDLTHHKSHQINMTINDVISSRRHQLTSVQCHH